MRLGFKVEDVDGLCEDVVGGRISKDPRAEELGVSVAVVDDAAAGTVGAHDGDRMAGELARGEVMVAMALMTRGGIGETGVETSAA